MRALLGRARRVGARLEKRMVEGPATRYFTARRRIEHRTRGEMSRRPLHDTHSWQRSGLPRVLLFWENESSLEKPQRRL